ncbi:MAG: hypothetical protein V4808_04800 [Pseudomonadota bacterium]
MATLAEPLPGYGRDDRFFLTMAIVMAAINVLGFSLQFAMGRSSFGAPLLIHIHAFIFFGWVVLYLLQNVFVYRGVMGLHRTLGWIGAVWMVAMVVAGIAVTVAMVQRGGVPFFFTPGYFLIMNPMTVLTFAGLTTAAIVLRKQTGWHRRLHYCGMALLMGPAIGRLLPVPFLIPWAGMVVFAVIMIFPLIGVAADWRRNGRVHPGWIWGIGAMVASQCVVEAVPRTPLGVAIYDAVAAGSPGAVILPMEYPPFPPMP